MRTRNVLRILLLSGFLIVVAGALVSRAPMADDSGIQAALSGPVLGYVLDGNLQAIRPVNGIVGSALMGAPLALPFPVSAAAFSSRGDFALAVSAQDHAAYLILSLGTAAPSAAAIPGALSGADRLALNADNTAAALYSPAGGQAQIIKGLPDNPSIGALVDLSAVSGKLTALALDRGASNLLVTAAGSAQGALYLWSAAADPGAPLRTLGTFGSPSALALLHGDQDAVVADAGSNQLLLIRNFAGSADVFALAGPNDGISNPVGLQAAADGARLFIADAGTPSLDVWNFAAQAMETGIPLDAVPSKLTRVQGQSTFLLNEVGSDPLLLLDAAAGSPAVYFVPAGKEQQ
ncbi:MAG TPA: hypothetical protein VEU62_22685 [Bryobacterales bacterium]|nr:hypothetical protein [Bryobacterales bacterium]